MRSIGKHCDVVPGKTPSKAAYTSLGDIKMVKFRDVLETGEVDYYNDEEGWFDSRYADDSDLVDLLPETILLTNAAHSTGHIGKKVAYVESIPNIASRVCYVGELTGIRSKTGSLYTKWLFYWLQTSDAKRAIVRAVEGAHLVPREFKRTNIPAFSGSEQKFHLTALDAVDDAIANAKTELEATRELKRSLIWNLLKNGIPATNQKQTTKIGELPVRWKLKKGRELFKLYGSKAGEPAEISESGECHYLKVDDFNSPGNEKRISDAKIKFSQTKNPGYPTYPAGCIVFAKRGAALLKDRVRILGTDSMIDPNLMVMACNEETISTDFMYHYLTYFRLGRLCEDAGIPQLNNRDLYPKYFPVPDEQEQVGIVQALDIADETVNRVFEKVEALQQVKKSLLQNMLTGKIPIPEGAIHG